MSVKKLKPIALTDEIIRICKIVSSTGVKGYIVGGFIRDSLLGIKTLDLDLAIVGNTIEISSLLAQKTNGKCITLDKERGIYRVISGVNYSKIQIDIAAAPMGIKKDLSNRDFTINSMAIDISNFNKSPKNTIGFEELLDPHNGIKSLEAGELITTSDNALSDDPIRLIRAIRVSAQLNLHIHSKLKTNISTQANLLSLVAGERIRTEFFNILKLSNSGEWLKTMNSLGLLAQIIPELECTKGVGQPKEHYWDVFDHLIESVIRIEEIFKYCFIPNNKYENNVNPLLDHIPIYPDVDIYFNTIAGDSQTRIITSKLACLLHDIGKPVTKTVDKNGQVRFLGHGESGSIMTEKILKKLKCSNDLTEIVSKQVKYHLRPSQISTKPQMPSQKAISKYFRDLGNVSIDTLYLNMADYMAARGPLLEETEWKTHCSIINIILKNYLNGNTPDKIPNLVSGQDIMDKLNLDPSPLIGNILSKVREAQEDGIIKNKNEALNYIEKFVSLGE